MNTLLQNQIWLKLGNEYVLYIPESYAWVNLQEPAWYIYKKLISGTKPEIIFKKFSIRYGLNLSESKSFVNDIIQKFQVLNKKSFKPQIIFPGDYFTPPEKFFSCRVYKINRKLIRIQYSSKKLEYAVHPSFDHLEDKSGSNAHHTVNLFTHDSDCILSQGEKAWEEKNANFLKRRLFIELTNLIYNKSESNWLSFIHGSAVNNGKETLVLSTACGSGKSTLAALLCAKGLKFSSDDYVPVDARFGKAYPFPAALSVKNGAYSLLQSYFPQLEEAEKYYFRGSNKTVKYLSFPEDKDSYKPLPVKNIVFVQFEAGSQFSFRRVPIVDAIKRFNDEAWVSPLPKHARKFLKWFPKINCYELIFSENEKAVNAVMKLFSE